jgi:hypothetical protein
VDGAEPSGAYTLRSETPMPIHGARWREPAAPRRRARAGPPASAGMRAGAVQGARAV